jgi:hypothetical protein
MVTAYRGSDDAVEADALTGEAGKAFAQLSLLLR